MATFNFTLPTPVIKAKASSSFTLQQIDKRLCKLAEMDMTADVMREILYLRDLREREFPTA